jgi:hypothetical protein
VWWDTLLGRAGEAGADRDPGPIPRWVAVHERAALITAGALGALVLVAWTHPTGMVVLLISVVTLLAMGGLRLVAEVSRRADAQPDAVIDERAIDVRQSEPAETVTELGAVEETTTSGRD